MIADIDITAPEVLRNPYALFAELRRTSAVGRLQPQGFMAVGRYQDVARVLHDAKGFSNRGWAASLPRGVKWDTSMPPSIVQVDPPRHGKLRTLVTKAFTPRTVAQLEPRIRDIAHELVDGLRGKSTFEATVEVTVPMPMIVIAEMLGVAPERRADFKRWSDDMVGSLALVRVGNAAQLERSTQEFYAYFSEVLEERRREPREDLISQLLAAEVDGEKLTAGEVLSFANTLLIAGNETTTSLIGNALVALTDHPEQLAAAQADLSLVPAVVEEVLRYESPAQCIFRQTMTDVEIGDERIPARSVVLPLLASANRDESRFPDPDRFDIHRDTKGHLAFGLDIHFCIGAPLARLEAKVMLEVLLARLGDIQRVSQEVSWSPSFFIRSPSTLPLRATVASA
ncbi:cytochrome P450 [Chondromyces apiculatus]|uniref:Putative cytochrome P450 hydroxylase n=1 Tax=Chondromyces apiculatus DSM 436 TaxID=1192034 RepID=A0A017T5A5_9BACT|nr:cytochrome P450 [Chondromyces apiculatus]EYF04172.1 putative cytochrome P450 hydroxylase [Chondromyces apiculatus DSM 436]6GMF_A Chain A, Putative cytochrome P450 hydroxylase [Chondromyces apiculatus DSM 436]